MRRLVLVIGVGLLWGGAALAACPIPYTGAELSRDLSTMASSLRNLDEPAFLESGKRLDDGLVCADRGVPVRVYASVYRYIGAYRFFRNDEPGARQWFRTAIELEPTFEWDASELELSHPMRRVYEEERATAAASAPQAVEGFRFVATEGSSYLLDGRPLAVPEATLERPHLLQQVSDADQTVLQAFLMDGDAFPTSVIEEDVVEVAAVETKTRTPKGKRGETINDITPSNSDIGYGVVKVERVRPKAKTPMLILGGVGVAAGGALYGLSAMAHQDFAEATTTEALLDAQSRTNTLVIAAGAAAVAGLGAGYVGVMLDGSPGFVIGLRY